MNKLSYKTYGNIVISVLILLSLLISFIPFSFKYNMFYFNFYIFICCLIQIPLYLVVRSKFEEPIHAIGLNLCFTLTFLFYLLIDILILLTNHLTNIQFTFILASIHTILACYFTSTLSNKQEDKGKLFFGKKSLKVIYSWIRCNQNDSRVIAFEDRLKKDNFLYTVYQEIFIKGTSWIGVADILNLDHDTYLEKYIYHILGRLATTIYEIDDMCREYHLLDNIQ